MKMRTFAAFALVTSLTACADMTTRERNTLIGAGIGAGVGAAVTDGALGAAAGAAAGGIIGHELSKDKKK